MLHGVTGAQLAAYGPLLTLKKGLSTDEHSIEDIAERIVEMCSVGRRPGCPQELSATLLNVGARWKNGDRGPEAKPST